MSDDTCTPRARWTEQTAAVELEKTRRLAEAEQRLADAERASLDDPDRPRVLRPGTPPDMITVRIVSFSGPSALSAELSLAEEDQTSMSLESDDPGAAMAGAEVALAALGYILDRFRLYQDMSLMVGRFYREPGPFGATGLTTGQ